MHTGQLFPAVCFWKNLIPDAVKYWFSLTSVKALIFLLRLNNLSNKIFLAFLGFNKWSHTHTFLPRCRVFVHAFLLHQTYGFCCCYSKLLELGLIMATRGAMMMIKEIDSPTFFWLHSLFMERVEKWRSPRACWRIVKMSWPRRTRFKQIFCSPQKDSSYRKCSIVLFIPALMSTWFDNRCLSPSISHSSSISPVLEC